MSLSSAKHLGFSSEGRGEGFLTKIDRISNRIPTGRISNKVGIQVTEQQGRGWWVGYPDPKDGLYLDRAWCLIEYVFRIPREHLLWFYNQINCLGEVSSSSLWWAAVGSDFPEEAQHRLQGCKDRRGHEEALSLPPSLAPTLKPFVSREEIVKPGRRRRRKTSKEFFLKIQLDQL